MTPIKLALILLATSVVLTACCSILRGTDVTNNPEHWGGFKPEEQYVLVEDVFIADRYENRSPPAALVYPGHPAYPQFPSSIDEYRVNPAAYGPERYGPGTKSFGIIGVVPKGSRVEVQELRRFESLGRGPGGVTAYGTVVDGPFSGRPVVLDWLAEARDGLEKSRTPIQTFLQLTR